MRARASWSAVIAIAAIAGCKDSGLPDRNLPLDEATHRPSSALVQAVYPELAQSGASTAGAHPAGAAATGDAAHAEAAHGADSDRSRPFPGTGVQPVRVGGQTFIPAGRPVDMGAASMTPVGGVGPMAFSAARGDAAPYDRLYMAHPEGGFLVYEPVHDATGDATARAAALEHGIASGGAGAAH